MKESEAFDTAISKKRKQTVAKYAKWIRENVGADVAVDFLNAMGYPMNPVTIYGGLGA